MSAMNDLQPSHAVAAQLIYDGFRRYNQRFKTITDRARPRFERRDWQGQIRDMTERVELYENQVREVNEALRRRLGASIEDRDFWKSVRGYFGSRLENVPDAGFMKTFYNSITRRIHGTVGIDADVEFVQPKPDEGVESLSMRRYPCWGDVQATCDEVLRDFRTEAPYKDRAGSAAFMAGEVRACAGKSLARGDACLRFEFIDSHFFQGERAYLVGRILHPRKITPIVVALENVDQGADEGANKKGVVVDAVLMEEESISVVFSYTRSYYFADPTSVVAAVQFLHSILPRKPLDELYTVLGRLRQGKTERYRIFTEHLAGSDDRFVHADGDAGLVMIVFTLPSYNLVFKIIRDRFGYPKTTTKKEVVEKYRLVSRHDHAGRLIDTQHFRNLELPKARFEPALLADLLENAKDAVWLVDDRVVLNHAYVERRVRPLNLYIREADHDTTVATILDYGQAIRDLAETNIFPGDLLLKNFGVTDSGRVVFYDYDEVSRVTECRFLEIPEPEDDEYSLMDTPALRFVNDTDIFPEEFIKFLAMDAALRKVFLQVHGDLLTAEYWRGVKNRRLKGEITQVVPYVRRVAPARVDS